MSEGIQGHGLCQCGCGGTTKIALNNQPKFGLVKGEPAPFIKGHQYRTQAWIDAIKDWNKANYGLCMCGCGQKTRVPECNDAFHGTVKGIPVMFIRGHALIDPRFTPTTDKSDPGYGICKCGCGGKTSIATKSDASSNTIKGEPLNFIKHHKPKLPPVERELTDWEKTNYGSCMCGCGGKTKIARFSDAAHGLIRGAPLRFIYGHGAVVLPATAFVQSDKGYGICNCGCGEPTEIAIYNSRKRGHIKGQPLPYKKGHLQADSRKRGGDTLRKEDNYKITDTGCWEWQGQVYKKSGYGHLRFNSKTVLAHRFTYEKHVGPIPKGLDLDHKCRNRRCVCPDHLEPVTRTVNLRRGATPVINEVKAAQIRICLGYGMMQKDIAELFGIGRHIVCSIKLGKTWKIEKEAA